MPRHADPELEQRILDAASRLWARSGEKGLTMRAVAKAAGTTTPTVYERYRDRNDILRALRLRTRVDLYATLRQTRTLQQAVERHLEFALEHRYAYEMLFDGVAQPPSLHEPWPSFNLFRQRLADRLGGSAEDHTRLMLALWSLMHGAAMLIIRGRFEGALRTQMVHACIDALDGILDASARSKGKSRSGPQWPANLVLGAAAASRVEHENPRKRGGKKRASSRPAKKAPLRS